MPKALIAMSGGVDSSVAALLMKQRGYECIGMTMKLFTNEDISLSKQHTCCSLEDVADARSVAYSLGMPHYTANFAARFKQDVIDHFIDDYEHGRTPNPCIDCNRHLKFDQLFLRAKELECDYVVTGHYARVIRDEETGLYQLKKALDPTKDQSYVLYAMSQEQLSHTQFPLGDMTKTETRAIAEEHGFINAKKHDSQDICFVPDGRYADFIRGYTGKEYPPGPFLDTEGNVLGTHKGIIHYTVGQRKGLGLSLPEPLYVKYVDPVNNAVILAPDHLLYSRNLIAHDLQLIAATRLTEPVRLKAKIRYRQAEEWATVIQTDEDTLSVEFDEPQRAITPGQAVVLYDGDIVVGGGIISLT